MNGEERKTVEEEGGGRRVMGGYRRGGRVEWRVRRVKQISRLRK
jgi:hypothetical protein